MRRLTEKQAKFENEAQTEPSAHKNRSGNRVTSVVNLDNDTTVEVFKYLKYCGLAKTSLVSKRVCDLIRTHRHTLALLDIFSIDMHECTDIDHNPTGIKIFDKMLSAEAYNDWVIRNGYSKQIPLKTQIAGMQSTGYERKVYRLRAYACYKDSAFEKKSSSLGELQKFIATVELSNDNWPVFQHFFALLTDPFVYIRLLRLPYQNDAFHLLAGAFNPDCSRIQCHLLMVILKDNMQNRISWIKGHVRCYQFYIDNRSGSNHDDEFVDFFMTGANCISEISLNLYDPSKVFGDFVQKFMDLKGCDGNKVVGTIECHPNANGMDALKRDYSDFVVEGNINDTSRLSTLVFEFVNNDIGKKLRLTISFRYRMTVFTLKVANL
ncbi:hypothetical protein Ddc_17047 [Ditylenchus destructor]|nr:hypothetical protein Ddc_17047 [Ditylenchus destructor]